MIIAGIVANADPPSTAAAAFDPATNRWRRLPPPPPGGPGRYEGELESVWTGSEMIVLGASFHTAYSPAANRWRTLADVTAAHLGGFALVWTGTAVLTWGGGCCAGAEATGAAYTPATDSWAALPRSPLVGRLTTGAWTGTELVIAGGTSGERTVLDSGGHSVDIGAAALADAAAYNPRTRSWRLIAPLPAARTGATLTWDGRELLLVGGGDAHRSTLPDAPLSYDPAANRWQALPPDGGGRVGHAAAWTGRRLLVWGGGQLRGGGFVPAARGAAYDPATRSWSPLPLSPLRGRQSPTVVWTGRALLVWGGDERTDGAVYRP